MRNTSVYLDSKFIEKIECMAKKEHRSKSSIINQALDEFFTK